MSRREKCESLDQLASLLIERRMVAPAIFMLELSKPLIGCARELYGITEGLQRVLFGSQVMPVLKDLLSSVEQVEALIVLLERGDSSVCVQRAEDV